MKRWMMIMGLVLLVGCSAGLPPTSPLSTPGPASPVATPPGLASPLASPSSGNEQNPIIQRAIEDLAIRLSIGPGTIQVGQVQADEFPAQGLGCAAETPTKTAGDQPAFVTGLSIQLQAGDARYEYRSHGQQLVYCGRLDR
jgi:hypothetical protein